MSRINNGTNANSNAGRGGSSVHGNDGGRGEEWRKEKGKGRAAPAEEREEEEEELPEKAKARKELNMQIAVLNKAVARSLVEREELERHLALTSADNDDDSEQFRVPTLVENEGGDGKDELNDKDDSDHDAEQACDQCIRHKEYCIVRGAGKAKACNRCSTRKCTCLLVLVIASRSCKLKSEVEESGQNIAGPLRLRDSHHGVGRGGWNCHEVTPIDLSGVLDVWTRWEARDCALWSAISSLATAEQWLDQVVNQTTVLADSIRSLWFDIARRASSEEMHENTWCQILLLEEHITLPPLEQPLKMCWKAGIRPLIVVKKAKVDRCVERPEDSEESERDAEGEEDEVTSLGVGGNDARNMARPRLPSEGSDRMEVSSPHVMAELFQEEGDVVMGSPEEDQDGVEGAETPEVPEKVPEQTVAGSTDRSHHQEGAYCG